jgi:DNA repair protein REV1
MKVVRPEWLLDSVTANKLLLWSDYKWSAHTLNSPTQMSAPGTPMLRPSARPSAISPGTPNVVAAAFVPPPKQPLSNATRSSSPPQVGAQSGKAIETLAFQPPEVVETGSPLVSSEPTRPSSSFATLAPAPAESSRAAYAIHAANPAAERLMESAEWREAHTSASGEAFIQGYYQNSRLHHLSKWKSELRSLVAKAQEDAEAQFSLGGSTNGFNAMSMDSRRKDKGKGRSSEKVIMHCDFDSFFVAAGLVTRPELKDKPVVVCHASGKGVAHSTSEIASASYAARAFGVKNGMRQVRAKSKYVIF